MPKKRQELWVLYLNCRYRSEGLILYESIFDPALAGTQQDISNNNELGNVRQSDIPCDDVPVCALIANPKQSIIGDNLQVHQV